MIVVTGGAGFIGSALVWRLNGCGRDDITIVDLPGTERHPNLRGLDYRAFAAKEDFAASLEGGEGDIEVIFHLGACSDTTETDEAFLDENNTGYTLRLARAALERGIRFVYASSAATYGDGSAGYGDDHAGIPSLRPLNLYAKSKQAFDLIALEQGMLDRIAGLKYFNVYGPNEYHKGDMRSMVLKGYEQVRDTGRIRLFASDRPGIGDGEQDRDFIYVTDAVDMTLFFWENPAANGIFNIGTGAPSTWNQLARAIFAALGREPAIEYVEMPARLRGKYQYHTRAVMDKLRAAGYASATTPFAEAVGEYVNDYLVPGAHLSRRGTP